MALRKRPSLDTPDARTVEDSPVTAVESGPVSDEVPGDPDADLTCVYKGGRSKIVSGPGIQAAYRDGWYDIPTDHPASRENLKR